MFVTMLRTCSMPSVSGKLHATLHVATAASLGQLRITGQLVGEGRDPMMPSMLGLHLLRFHT